MQVVLNIVLASLACHLTCADDDKPEILSQPIGLSGSYLTTSIGIGTPPQSFDLGIQLNSDKTVISDISTQNTQIDDDYNYIKALFEPTESDTADVSQQLCRTRYVIPTSTTAKLSYGHYVNDVISVGDIALPLASRVCDLDEQRTSQYTTTDPLQWFMNLPIDGFLGLGSGGENILRKSSNDLKQISLFYNRNYTEVDNVGTITYGGPDTKNCKEFKQFPAEDGDSWRMWVTKAKFNDKEVSDTFSTLIDLSADKLIVPRVIYTAISNYFGSTSYITCSRFTSTTPQLELTIYGKTYSISVGSYLVPMSSSTNQCYLNIDTPDSDAENQIVLNRHILDNYCLLIDYDELSIGFAAVV